MAGVVFPRCMKARLLPLLGLLFPLSASAYSVSPNLLLLRPQGGNASGFIQLANRSPQPVAVELTVHPHHRDIDGRSLEGPADDAGDDFLLYPAQLVLLPGDETSVQVRWIGPAMLDTERAYTVVTRQVPIPRAVADAPEPVEGVHLDLTVLMNYEVRVYVTPPGAKPKVVVESITTIPEGTDSDQLEIMLVNQGTARATLGGASLELRAERSSSRNGITLPPGSLPALKIPLLPGERRRLVVPRPPALPPGPVRASLAE
jgi:fimbrial chaperone protein